MSLTPHREPLKRAAHCGLIVAVAASLVGTPQSKAASPPLGVAEVGSAFCGNNVIESCL